MTAESARERLPGERPARHGLNPLVTVRVFQIALWILVVSGPVAALLVATQESLIRTGLDVVSTRAGMELAPDTTGAQGFAELFIATYLGAGEASADALGPFLRDPSLDGVEAGSWLATRTTSLGVEEVGPGYYAALIAAEVVAADPESDGQFVWVPVGTRFYWVGVLETATGWVIAGLPTLVSAPPRAEPPDLLIRRFDGLDTAPGLEEMLPHFLGAYLTGEGELTTYTSPSSHIAPVKPPPFVIVEILRAGLVDTMDSHIVAVVVRATDEADRAQVLEYSLVVEQRDGRWEVSQLLPAPPLAP